MDGDEGSVCCCSVLESWKHTEHITYCKHAELTSTDRFYKFFLIYTQSPIHTRCSGVTVPWFYQNLQKEDWSCYETHLGKLIMPVTHAQYRTVHTSFLNCGIWTKRMPDGISWKGDKESVTSSTAYSCWLYVVLEGIIIQTHHSCSRRIYYYDDCVEKFVNKVLDPSNYMYVPF
jgi:hypothetical protein